MLSWIRSGLTMSAALALIGCAREIDGAGEGAAPALNDSLDGKADFSGSNAAVLPTHAGAAKLMGGYHTLFDQTVGACVEPSYDEPGAAYAVGDLCEVFDLSFVSSREELAEMLEIDLGLKAKIPAAASIETGLNMVNTFASRRDSISLLLRVRKNYTVLNRRDVKLNARGQEALDEGMEHFVRACGTNYIDGIRYGGHLYLLITYSAYTEEAMQSMKASLNVGAKVKGVPVDGDLQMRLERTAQLEGVSVNVDTCARGFLLSSGDVNAAIVERFVGKGISAETFQAIDDIYTQLSASIERDACRDAGEGECSDGRGALGFFDNTRRNSEVTGVRLGMYPALVDAADEFKAADARIQRLKAFFYDVASVRERIEGIYWSEIAPFMAAGERKISYNVAPPGEPKRALRAGGLTDLEAYTHEAYGLNEMGSYWQSRFYPLDPQAGTPLEALVEMTSDCWREASLDHLHDCVPEGYDSITETPEWAAALAEIERYEETGRIVPLRYKIGEDAQKYRHADEYCRELSADGVSYRLPNLEEAKLLGPLVGFGDVEWADPWFGDPSPHEIFFDFTEPGEDPAEAAPTIYANFPSASDYRIYVEPDWERKLTVICVPMTGPIPVD